LRHSHLGDRHHQRLQQRQRAAAEIPDWRLPDLPPNPIAHPAADALAVGDRLVELPGKPTERRGYFIGWGLHRQRGELLPIVRWDGTGHQSFSDLRILTLETAMNTPHDPPSSLEAVRQECHRLIDRLSRRNIGLKLLINARNMLMLLDGYKSKRQSLGDRPKRG
jgi:hypothetical protein